MTETTFAAKMKQADDFRAQISDAITEAMAAGSPDGKATLRKLAASLADVPDGRMYRASVCGEMILRPMRAVLGEIVKGGKSPYANMRVMLDRIGAAAATLQHHRANTQQMVETLMTDRFPGPTRLIRVI